MKETKTTEFKEAISKTFLKTVSAFSNYDGGIVYFGVDDNGATVGIKGDLNAACMKIENMINTTIKPQPDYTLVTNSKDKTIELIVKPGTHQPYLYNGKAYKRNDTSTIEVDDIELRRLVLAGEHLTFESQPAKQNELHFALLEQELINQLGIKRFDNDLLKTLNLYSDDCGYNNAAAILSDNNSFPGIDVAKFGDTISVIQKRVTVENKSILAAFHKAMIIYRDYYQHEEIVGDKRRKIETIPEAAYREAVANAVIHREWDVKASIRISMFDDHIEVVSPGGLPSGISKKEYQEGRYSVLRNPILANVFNRLNIVEAFGTGVLRIKELYANSASQPEFDVGENSIKVMLPVLQDGLNLSEDERTVYNVLSKTKAKPISEIMSSKQIEFGKSKVTEILKRLDGKKLVVIEGNGRGTKYRKRNNLVVDDILIKFDENDEMDKSLIDSIKSLGWDDVLTDDTE